MTTELMERPEKEISISGTSPVAIMQAAMQNGADFAALEKMMELQERWERNEAKKAYHRAMADFKADPPRIDKDKTVSYTGTSYTHASLGNVTEMINKSLGKHGLTAAWKTEQENGSIIVTCSITHKYGHAESTALSSPPDQSGKKNPIQAMGSTITYLQRYTLLALTGLATHDQDDDAHTAQVAMIDEKQVSSVVDMMNKAGVDHEDFLKYLKVETVESIPASWYPRVISDLKAVIAQKGGAA